MITKEHVYKIAHLARLNIEESKAQRYASDLSNILGYMDKLNAVNVNNVEPMTHVHGSKNIFRNDETQKSMPVEEVLMNAPDRNGQFIRVPIIREIED